MNEKIKDRQKFMEQRRDIMMKMRDKARGPLGHILARELFQLIQSGLSEAEAKSKLKTQLIELLN